jgi:hypothetical protein
MKRNITNLAVLMFWVAANAVAGPLIVEGSQGDRSFSALFENVGAGNLQITISNTGSTAPADAGGVIGALFFNLNGDPTLTPVSMSLGTDSSIVNGSGDPSPNWQYARGFAGPGGATQGVSAAGYGLFGSIGNFYSGVNCGNLLQGIDWGLVNAAYTPGTGNASISGQPMIQDTAVFLLSGIALDFDPANDVTDVYAQYTATLTGTNLAAPDPSTVPEPATSWLIVTGVIMMIVLRSNDRRKLPQAASQIPSERSRR